MTTKATRAATVFLAALAIPAAILGAPLAASAAAPTEGRMCEYSGVTYCLNTANFNTYTPVVESNTGTRTIDELQDGTNSWLLVFNGTSGAHPQCVAADNAGTKVEVKPCFGSSGVYWTRVGTSHADAYKWINQAASKTMGTSFELTGVKNQGQYELRADGLRGAFQVFIIG